MTLELRSTNDKHIYEVCLTEDGIKECTFVNNMNLVYDKERQLRNAIKRRALDSFISKT